MSIIRTFASAVSVRTGGADWGPERGLVALKRFSKNLRHSIFEKRSKINSVSQRFSLNLIQIKRKTL